MSKVIYRPMVRRALPGATVGLALSACAGPQVQDYAREQPRLDLRTFLSGELNGKD